MSRPISLDGFEAVFRGDPDPWRTFSARDEALKRQAILHALGTRVRGRVLELGAGNGSNSRDLARRALRLDATDGAPAAVRLIAERLEPLPGARALQLALPAPLPQARYDAVVIAELLYYLPAHAMAQTSRDVVAALGTSGRLVLAHHHIQFHDFAQRAVGIHARFLRASGRSWRIRPFAMTRRWTVIAAERIHAEQS